MRRALILPDDFMPRNIPFRDFCPHKTLVLPLACSRSSFTRPFYWALFIYARSPQTRSHIAEIRARPPM